MRWLALQWLPDPAPGGSDTPAELPTPTALAWWALRFTPHVAWVDEALLLEVAGTLRLWGGRHALQQLIFKSNPCPALMQQAQAATSLIAMARLRLRVQGMLEPPRAAAFALHTLSAARPHLPVLERLGCRTWGDLAALPRAGLARRFGPALGQALDVALGRAPDIYPWATLPERFVQSLELPHRADSAPALLWSASRLLTSLQMWLQARQLGVLAIELRWRLDVRRLNGQDLPPEQALTVRTAQPVQHMEHLRRLLAERLARTAMLAPAVALSLRALHTAPWQGASHSLLMEEQRTGEPLHVLIERLSARLGADQVLVPELQADHRPECRQRWRPATQVITTSTSTAGTRSHAPRRGQRPTAADTKTMSATTATHPASAAAMPDAMAPTSLLPQPLPLNVRAGQPQHHGPLRLLTGARRIEAGWWPDLESAPVSRDYFIAQNPHGELLWIYRERPTRAQSDGADGAARWFLHGLYA